MSPHRSFWLQEIAADAPEAPPLGGEIKADVAIVGGGFVGLWTAIRIKEHSPACEVVVLEQDICGGGASPKWRVRFALDVQAFLSGETLRHSGGAADRTRFRTGYR